jgi:ribosomal protein S18 acetylase RimI-like enzyme
MEIDVFTSDDRNQVVQLWAAAGLTRPWNLPEADIERKEQMQPELFFVARDEGQVIGSVMAGYEGHRGWIHYLAVDSKYRGRGVGKALLQRAEAALAALGCPKVQLQVRPDNEAVVDYYEHLGYSRYETISMGKRLVHDATT